MLPGAAVPECFHGVQLPPGYSMRQDRDFVYLCYGAEDVVGRWAWRKIPPIGKSSLRRRVKAMATRKAKERQPVAESGS